MKFPGGPFVVLAAFSICAGLPPAASAVPALDPAKAPGGHYVLDPRHTSVTARVRHFGLSMYTMRFDRIEGAYDYDPRQPLVTRIQVKIDAHSLDTGVESVSKQFAGQFLDADQDPEITFVSTAIQPAEGARGALTGDLTFHGVTRPVTLDVTYDGTDENLIGGRRMAFSATGVIRRSQFGSKALLGDVGDEVQLLIETEFVRR